MEVHYDEISKNKLRQMGVNAALLEHPGFNAVYFELSLLINKCASYNVNLENAVNGQKTAQGYSNIYGKQYFANGFLKIDGSSIVVTLEGHPDTYSTTECFAESLKITLENNNQLTCTVLNGQSKLLESCKEQQDFVTATTFKYDSDGVNVLRKEEIHDRTLRVNSFLIRDSYYYPGVQGKQTTTTFMRQGLDLAWCLQEKSDNPNSKSGYCVLSGEYGFQKMNPMTCSQVPSAGYFWPDKGVPVSADYERDLAKDPESIQNALRSDWMNKTAVNQFNVTETDSRIV